MELFTIQDISKKLDVAESTLRYWRDRFEDFIPTVGEGRKKRYKTEAILVFQRIAELSAEKRTAESIAELLKVDFYGEIALRSDNSGNAATKMDLYTFQQTLIKLALNQEKMLEMMKENMDLQNELVELRGRMDKQEEIMQTRDKKLMEAIREIQERKEKNKNWWKFWQS